MEVRRIKRQLGSIRRIFFLLSIGVFGCSGSPAMNHFELAEKLWAQGEYSAAAIEYEQSFRKDPKSAVGQKSLFMAAETEHLFLKRYEPAVQKYGVLLGMDVPVDMKIQAHRRIGEIFFYSLKEYRAAILHIETFLKSFPGVQNQDELKMLVAKSWSYLAQPAKAEAAYDRVIKEHPDSKLAERAALDKIGLSFLSKEGETKERMNRALQQYQQFIAKYPGSPLVVEARFSMASCLEELDRLPEALEKYQSISDSYPSPGVIQVKVARIQQRIRRQGR